MSDLENSERSIIEQKCQKIIRRQYKYKSY